MIKILIEEDYNRNLTSNDEIDPELSLLVKEDEPSVDEIITKIFSYNPELLNEKNVLVINHPLCKIELLNEDVEVIEPTVIEDIISSIISRIGQCNYCFILFNNIESYVIKNQDSTPLPNYLVNLSKILETLDDFHIEIFVNISEEFYKNNQTIFDIYLD